jgi:hypothetical protein
MWLNQNGPLVKDGRGISSRRTSLLVSPRRFFVFGIGPYDELHLKNLRVQPHKRSGAGEEDRPQFADFLQEVHKASPFPFLDENRVIADGRIEHFTLRSFMDGLETSVLLSQHA